MVHKKGILSKAKDTLDTDKFKKLELYTVENLPSTATTFIIIF